MIESDPSRHEDKFLEQRLVGYVLSNVVKDKSVLERVDHRDFADATFSDAWRHARALWDRGERVNARSVLRLIGKSSVAPILEQATVEKATAVLAEDAAVRIPELARLRRLTLAMDTAREQVAMSDDYAKALDCALEATRRAEGVDRPKDMVSFADALNEWREYASDDNTAPRVFPTPWDYMNRKLAGGVHAGRTYIVAARPGGGKSLMGANIAQHAAEQGHTAAIFSVEMGSREVTSRLLAAGANAEYGQITKREIDAENWQKIDYYASTRQDIPLFINDKSSISLNYVFACCRNLKRTKGLDVVFVDYLQLMRPTNSKLNRDLQIGEITRGLKVMARELDCAVVIACQLNRDSERDKRRPQLSDLRESGNIEQDADVVVLIHRTDETEVQFIVAKNRTGEQCDSRQLFVGAKAKIV